VLPLENQGRAEDEWFGDGLADELRGALSRYPDLLVKGSRSSTSFKGTTKSLKQIARELGVVYLVVGSVRWEPTAAGRGGVRVSPELIDVRDESTKWKESFDTELTDLFGGQKSLGERVARRIGSALALSLDAHAQDLDTAATSVKPEAFVMYLRGRRELVVFTPSSQKQAVRLFRQATQLDPSFGKAQALAGVRAPYWAQLQRRHGRDGCGQRARQPVESE
jgi:TolB-like protein